MAARLWVHAGVLAAASALGACASPAPPAAPGLAAGNASLEAARSAGAPEYAAAEYEMARTKLDRARALAATGDGAAALRLAEQAEADAQLARARASSQRAQLALREIESSLRSFQEEIQRSSPNTPPTTLPVRP
jgi:multidrug resistance efflux pump